MSSPRFALAVTHAPWIPARVETMRRLRWSLGTFMPPIEGTCSPAPLELVAYHEETTRCPGAWWVWSELQWRWALDACRRPVAGFSDDEGGAVVGYTRGATHAIFLQDDVDVSPDFWRVIAAMVEGRPGDVIGLDCAHPAARTIAEAGDPGFTTCDGLIGIGYVFPAEVLADFMRWRASELVARAVESTTEDCLIGLYCMARGIRVFHPVPSPIDHDLGVASTNEGHDDHMYRAPQVTWRDAGRLPLRDWTSPAWWARPVAHVGRFYETLHTRIPLVLRDVDEGAALLARYQADRCPPAFRRFFLRVGA